MKTSKATISAILYTSKTLSNGEFPIMIRICYNGKRKYKSIGLSCSKNFWNSKKQEVKEKHKLATNMNTIINLEVSKLKSIVLNFERENKPYSVQTLVDASNKKLPSRKTLFDVFEERIDFFKKTTEKHNTATGYRTLLNVIKRFTNNKEVELFDINTSWLKDFEGYLRLHYADTSIKKFFDGFKAIINYSIQAKLISENPFTSFTFSKKLDTRTKKRALGIDEMNILFQYYLKTYSLNKTKPNLEKTKKHYWHSKYFKRRGETKLTDTIDAEQLSLSMFLCSYMMQGLALIDLANLKWSDLNSFEVLNNEKYDKDSAEKGLNYAEENKEMLNYFEINITRSKTQHPTRIIVKEDELFLFVMEPYTHTIKEAPLFKDKYIFPIFFNDDPEHKFGRMTYANYLVNLNLKRIAERVGLSTQSLTFYSARHSYASMLYHSDVPISLIAQNMGRNSADIETYLKEFDTNRIIDANNKIWHINQKGFVENKKKITKENLD